MRMNSILLLSVLFVQMFSSCNDNENETNIPVVEKKYLILIVIILIRKTVHIIILGILLLRLGKV